jgi:hypothetical protein
VTPTQSERGAAVVIGARPERRRRVDLAVAAALVVAAAVAGAVVWWRSPLAATTSVVAVVPIISAPEATQVPPGFLPAWREPSGATRAPLVAGPAVVTAEGGTVTGRDPQSGAPAWSYTREVPLCTAAAGFADSGGGTGRVFALFGNGSGAWCSELTTLRPDTGARAAQRNSDAVAGTSLLADAGMVALTDSGHAEVLRSPDLVRTLEYGDVPAPEQPNQQPRPGCAYGSFLLAEDLLGLVERCPDESTDRLTVLLTDGPDGAERPSTEFSVPLPGTGAVLVGLTSRRAAVALANPPRLLVVDSAGTPEHTITLDVPRVGLVADREGGAAAAAADEKRRYWWTGTHTIALDAQDLTPVWTLPGTLGAGVPYAGSLLVPVPRGLAVVDPATGAVARTIPVPRTDRAAPVVLGASGRVLLEQRGPELVALLPSG